MTAIPLLMPGVLYTLESKPMKIGVTSYRIGEFISILAYYLREENANYIFEIIEHKIFGNDVPILSKETPLIRSELGRLFIVNKYDYTTQNPNAPSIFNDSSST
jgi:hypothetical protein